MTPSFQGSLLVIALFIFYVTDVAMAQTHFTLTFSTGHNRGYVCARVHDCI